jgi:multiple sugar transport system substrate-binding protein
MKKLLVLVIALAMVVGLVACATPGGETSTAPSEDASVAPASDQPVATPEPDTGKVLTIYCWNEEFQSRFNDYFADKVPADVEVNWVITPNQNNAYQEKLDADLLNQDAAAADDKIDIFLIEADYADKYVNADTPVCLDVKGDLGLTDADLANQYEYTKTIASDANGVLRAVSWQATPGLFAYRRSIAKDVLGTEDPDEVQAALADWDKFDAVAAQMSDKGYKMLSGFDDAYRTFSNNMTAPWVDDSGKINFDPQIERWIEQTKLYTDKGYNNKTSLWAPEWAADQGPGSKVFGFFYSTWGINFTLLGNSLETSTEEGGKEEVGNGIYGDWAVCQGPQSYYWGGTWICGAVGTDNPNLVKDVMYTLTCDNATMKQITLDTQDYTNNQEAMSEIANDPTFGSDFLGGQNHIALFAEAAPKIDMSNISPCDQGCNEKVQGAFRDYFNGAATYDEALENFYTAVLEKYPWLTR